MYEDIFLLYMATRNVPYNGEHLEEYVSSVVEKTNDYMGYFGRRQIIPFPSSRFYIKYYSRNVLYNFREYYQG